MNKRENPYTPGAGRKPSTLAGRDEDLDDFSALTERLGSGHYDRSLIYTGLRGVGKTVLLIEFDVLASEAGWATTDVQEVGSAPDFRVTFTRMAARLLREISRRQRVRGHVERALGVVKAFSVATASGIQVKLDVDAVAGTADSGDPEQDLTDLLLEIGQVARSASTGALFLIDEMHNLDAASLAAICLAFQAISRHGLPVALVGAGLPDLQVRLMSAKPYADRLFTYHELGRLSDAAARAALIGPAKLQGVAFREEAARAVVPEAAGYPYFLQEYGLELLEPSRALADHARGRGGGSRCRQRLARSDVLRSAAGAGDRRGAALPRGDGDPPHAAVPQRRGGQTLRRPRSARRLHAP